MAETHWLRHTFQLTRAILQARVRGMRQNRYQYRMLTLSAVLFLLVILILGGIYAYGFHHATGSVSLSAGGTQPPLILSVVWLAFTFYMYRRATWYAWDLIDTSFLLTTVSPLTAVLSILLSESSLLYLILLLPTLGVLGAFLYGFAVPASIVMIPLTTALFTTTACVVSYAIGFAVLVQRGGDRATRNRWLYYVVRILIGVVIIGYFLSTVGIGPHVSIPRTNLVSLLPPGWFIDVAATGTPVIHSPARAVAAILGSLIVDGIGIAIIYQSAVAYWYDTPTSED